MKRKINKNLKKRNSKKNAQKRWRGVARRNLHRDQVIEVKCDGKLEGYALDQLSLANSLGVTVGMVSHVLSGRRNSVKGHQLKYVDSKKLAKKGKTR